MQSCPLHLEGGQTIKFFPGAEHAIASIGRPDNRVKVTNLKSKQTVLTGKLQLVGGLSWHYKLPYVCAGNDRELWFWRANIK